MMVIVKNVTLCYNSFAERNLGFIKLYRREGGAYALLFLLVIHRFIVV
jgi:hypothetical protein